MTSIGTGYDLSNSVFSPDGRVFQVEYASKAVENGSTSLGIRAKDGVVLAVEKVTTSKLLKPGSNKRIQTVDKHIGVVYSGMNPDGRHVVGRARDEARNWRDQFREPMAVPLLANNVAAYTQLYTVYNSVRPFGVTTIIGGVDPKGPHLYMVEPSGQSWGYQAVAAGRSRQAVNSELEKLDFESLSVKDAVREAARILYLAHEDNKDKDFELEISWCTKDSGKHEFIPEDLRQEAIKYAEEALDADME
ncbi:hypothetical protein FF38_11117 [Lucilia cuprina]|uniref:Proteasome subunit alpha type n=1 Tax=Lucilia cuprina TaxID=7375 RepID=A0A0L0BSY1_LUCCU|nr:putative proteasome subunit alpha type-7 [Lucilia cuprina]KNC23152.1 hypothetical protein FF38_11117 [Lucilia cuprina]